jgi:hypothetical protein
MPSYFADQTTRVLSKTPDNHSLGKLAVDKVYSLGTIFAGITVVGSSIVAVAAVRVSSV